MLRRQLLILNFRRLDLLLLCFKQPHIDSLDALVVRLPQQVDDLSLAIGLLGNVPHKNILTHFL